MVRHSEAFIKLLEAELEKLSREKPISRAEIVRQALKDLYDALANKGRPPGMTG